MMKQIILTTIILDMLGSIMNGFLALLSNFSLGTFLYIAVFSFGNMLIPTLIGVIFFQIIKTKIQLSSQVITAFIQALVMLLVLIVGLTLWSIGDVVTHNDPLTFENVQQDFCKEFFGFPLGGAYMAIALPVVDHLWAKRIPR